MAVDLETKTEDLAGKLGTAETTVTPVTQGVQENELLGTQGQTLSETNIPTVDPKTLDPTTIGAWFGSGYYRTVSLHPRAVVRHSADFTCRCSRGGTGFDNNNFVR